MPSRCSCPDTISIIFFIYQQIPIEVRTCVCYNSNTKEVNARLENIIFHIDVISAFLSWEAVYRLTHRGGTLDLRAVLSAVGGDITLRHGIILAKSIPAKDCGVKTRQTIAEAKKQCPNLMLVPPNYGLYEECSAAFMDILREYSDVVEQFSIDEAFVDMSATCHLFGTPEGTAREIKDRIRDELGFTVNIGVSDIKMLAYRAARGLFLELWDGRRIRHLGVHTSRAKKDDPGRQMSLFDEVDYEKLAVMDRTVDAIRDRFGIDSVKRTFFLNQSVDHMSGISKATGLLWEKRTVDYDKVTVL